MTIINDIVPLLYCERVHLTKISFLQIDHWEQCNEQKSISSLIERERKKTERKQQNITNHCYQPNSYFLTK